VLCAAFFWTFMSGIAGAFIGVPSSETVLAIQRGEVDGRCG
jgi:predicted PurR-regulated permease PerM